MPVHQNSFRRKTRLKYNITFANSPFSHQNTIQSTLESSSLDEIIRCASKWPILTQRTQILEFVNLKSVNYTQPISPFLKGLSLLSVIASG